MPSINLKPNEASNFDDAFGDSFPKRMDRNTARYEAHQELHKLPSAELHRIISDYESRQGFDALAFSWNCAKDVVEGKKCLTDMPDIRYGAAKAIFKERFG